MADQGGVSKLAATIAANLPVQPRTIDTTASVVSTAGKPGQGAGRREVPDSNRRQTVNLDGQVLNRTAPRGTYINIVV